MSQEQIRKQPRERTVSEEIAAEAKERTKEHRELLDESKDWLDEIDEALEGLDQDLAREFVQKGGQ